MPLFFLKSGLPGIQIFAKDTFTNVRGVAKSSQEALKDLFRLGDERCGGHLLQEYVRRCESMQTPGVYGHSHGKACTISTVVHKCP